MVARPGALQATFNSGEVAPELYSRSDVKQFYASAATMENVEPVPQGGFRLLDRSRDLGPQRTALAPIVGTFNWNSNNLPGGSVVALLTFPSADLSAVRLAYTASIDAEARLLVEYQDATSGNWGPLAPAYAVRTAFRQRLAARPPGQMVRATAVRLVTTAGAAMTVNVTDLAAFGETGALVEAQLLAFTFSTSTPYMLVLAGQGVADVYRDGQWVASAWHSFTADRIADVTAVQRLETALLFHQDSPTVRLLHGNGGDHDWHTDQAPFADIPAVDLGGTYAKVAEQWQVALRWPTVNGAGPQGFVFTVTVDGQDTTAIGIPDVGASRWNTVAPDLQGKLRSLSTVGPGCTVTVGDGEANGKAPGLQLLNVFFDGGNTGSRFTVSAKFINTADAGANALRITVGDPGGEPLFSATRGYATSGIFYQDRLVSAGFRSKPGAVLASPAADYYSGVIDVDTASGGILLNLDTDGAEQVRRLARSKHLVIFTTDAEYYVSDRVIRRDQPVNVVESSRNGSCPTVPICTTETGLLYVSRARSLIYSATYDDVASAYVSDPLSLLARHLIQGVRGAALQRANDRSDAARYFAVRDDGLMIVGLIIRSQDVTAFVRWRTDGKVRAVAVDGLNRVYLIVERIVAGVARRRVEWLEPGLLDGTVSQVFGTPQTVVSNLGAHEGAVVWAIGDGFAMGPFTVAGGSITLPIPVTTAHVGRWTPPLVKTLPLPREVGTRTVLLRPCRVFALGLRVIDTTSIAVGANGEAASDVALYRGGMPTDLPQVPVTDWLDVDGLEGWSVEGQATITQVRPGALQVAAVNVMART